MDDSILININDVKQFLESANKHQFKKKHKTEAYQWVEETLVKFHYMGLNKREKGIIKQYVAKMTHYSRAQITRLIAKYVSTGRVQKTEYQRE